MAKKAQADPALGEIKGKMPIYKNGLDISGEIILCAEGIIIRADGNTLRVPFRYVQMLEKSSEMPLGKVGVELEVFDQMGDKHYFNFGLSDNHFNLLKKEIGK
ncbi:MAG: hypothetical protein N3G22_04710 [Candidatus Micrarchaeota archaeon]|nr:hypothetical protein [Candidatus Micrarchaeota archaeon]